ncbi:MAG: MFS transporter [Phycisphaerales bacterium]
MPRPLYVDRTMLVLLAVGVSCGVPNMLATSVAPVWTTVSGWKVELIGFLAFAQLPYALKFMWAPLVDRVGVPGIGALGCRRAWIVATAAACAGASVLLALAGTGDPAVFLLILALLVFASATQDMVASAFQVESLEPRQLGAGAGMWVSGYRVAFAALGAGALVLAPKLGAGGWPIAVAACGIAGLACALCVLATDEPARPAPAEPGLRAAVVEPVASFVRTWRWRVLALAAFALVFRLPDQLGNVMLTPLLLKGLGYDAEQLGVVRQFLGFGLTIAGALLGGWMVARLGAVASLWISGILQAASNLVFWMMALVNGATVHADAAGAAPLGSLVAGIAVESVCGGMVSAVFVAFLMSICDRRMVATQYALLTALMAAAGAGIGGFGGMLARHLDFADYFLATALVGAPGIALVALVARPPAGGNADLPG